MHCRTICATVCALSALANVGCDRVDAGRPQPSPPPPAPVAPAVEAPVEPRSKVNADTTGDPVAGQLRLTAKGDVAPFNLRLATRGPRTRLEIERGKDHKPLTLLLTGDDVVVAVDDASRAYSSRRWGDLKASDEHEASVKLERTSERRTVSGLSCAVWRVTVEPQQAEACVKAAPVKLDPDKLEALARVDLPLWAERILEEGYLPLQATVRVLPTSNQPERELYRVELSEYSPEPASENEMAAPAAYKELKPTG